MIVIVMTVCKLFMHLYISEPCGSVSVDIDGTPYRLSQDEQSEMLYYSNNKSLPDHEQCGCLTEDELESGAVFG